ncbi:unnamed protein product [Polarella glacialis]|uniref:Protein ZIP4 homolog n=1 Tax=Polarella glacialis TaxID=89957 RepID=A0A813GS82_POLGL|nr:unnamed protein product [Polarella glacialis]
MTIPVGGSELRWAMDALKTSPDSVHKLALELLAPEAEEEAAALEGCGEASALDFAATAARLACMGLGAAATEVGLGRLPGAAGQLLEAAAAALKRCEELGGAEATALAVGVCFQEVAGRLSLGLAVMRSRRGLHQEAIEVLASMKGSGSLSLPKLQSTWLSLCILSGLRQRRDRRPQQALEAMLLVHEALSSSTSPPGGEGEKQPTMSLLPEGDFCGFSLPPWLFRQLAACHLALAQPAPSAEFAARAAELEAFGSKGRLAALRIKLRAECALGEAGNSNNNNEDNNNNNNNTNNNNEDNNNNNNNTNNNNSNSNNSNSNNNSSGSRSAAAATARALTEAALAGTDDDAMAVCHELLERGFVEPADLVLAGIRQRLGKAAGKAASEKDLCRLELFARATKAEGLATEAVAKELLADGGSQGGKETGGGTGQQPAAERQGDLQVDLVASARRLLGSSPPRLAAEQAARAWNLARSALARGRPDVAVAWLRHPSVSGGAAAGGGVVQGGGASSGPLACPASALAFCQLCAGGSDTEARELAESALGMPGSAMLASAVLLATQGGRSDEATTTATTTTTTAETSKLHLPPTAAAALARWVRKKRAPEAGVACLKALVASGVEAEALGGVLDLGSWLISDAKPWRSSDALGCVLDLGSASSKSTFGVLEALCSSQAAQPPGHFNNRVFFERFWNLGSELGSAGRWRDCARAFKLAFSGIGKSLLPIAADLSSENLPIVVRGKEEAQMCLAVQMASYLEEARQARKASDARAPGLFAKAARVAPAARALSEELAALRRSAGQQPGPDRAVPLLILMEFEARALCGDEHVGQFVAEVATRASLPAKCFLIMAQMALEAGHEVAMQCLRRYLRATADAAKKGLEENLEVFAIAVRELINLQESRDDSFGCFEEINSILQQAPEQLRSTFPSKELAWLLGIAWGNGAHHGRLGGGAAALALALRWVGMALSLLRFCSAELRAAHEAKIRQAYGFLESQRAQPGGLPRVSR